MKFMFSLVILLSFATSAFAQESGIATMFNCFSAENHLGRYHSVSVSTRDFKTIKAGVFFMQASKNGEDEPIDMDEDLSGKFNHSMSFSGGRTLNGYELSSSVKTIVYFSQPEIEKLAAGGSGKTVGYLKIKDDEILIRCEF